MKIILISDVFLPPFQTSIGMIVKNFAQELKNKGHDILIITSTQDKKEVGQFKYQGLNVWRVYANLSPRLRSYLTLYNPQSVKLVAKIIKQFAPAIVHVHLIHYLLSYHCLKIAKKSGAKVFLTVHDVMLFHYDKLMPRNGNYIYKVNAWDRIKEAKKRYNPFRNIIIRYYLKYVDKIFSVSNALRTLLEINDIKNIETIYNGINLNDWAMDFKKTKAFRKKYHLDNKKVIFFGGRLSGAKGGDQILRAIALIKRRVNNIILLVVGEENRYVREMKNLVRKLRIEKNVIFTDWLETNQLKAAYYNMDVAVFPSLCFESFGMTNLEAMACKKPVVSTIFGGPKEVVVDGKTGYLVNPNNIELMTDKIVDLLKNPQKARGFGEEGYLRAKELFSLHQQVERILKWYNKFIKI